MRKLNNHIVIKLTALIVVGMILLTGSCSTSKSEGFAIYLTQDDVPPSQMPVLSHVDLEDKPLFSTDDIISYEATTHRITLKEKAFNRITSLEVPVNGKSFMVCVEKTPVYWGAFWTPVSSLSFDGITIWHPFVPPEPKVIKLELGYPSSSFYSGKDPRNNPEIIRSLEQAGKLITSPFDTAADKLPHSMKGYELYSWFEDNQWHFTLITGTNRNKTQEEVTQTAFIISEDGWVQIHVAGIEAINSVLTGLPENEEIIWFSRLQQEQKSENDLNFSFPPEPTISTLKEHASQYHLKLHIQQY